MRGSGQPAARRAGRARRTGDHACGVAETATPPGHGRRGRVPGFRSGSCHHLRPGHLAAAALLRRRLRTVPRGPWHRRQARRVDAPAARRRPPAAVRPGRRVLRRLVVQAARVQHRQRARRPGHGRPAAEGLPADPGGRRVRRRARPWLPGHERGPGRGAAHRGQGHRCRRAGGRGAGGARRHGRVRPPAARDRGAAGRAGHRLPRRRDQRPDLPRQASPTSTAPAST